MINRLNLWQKSLIVGAIAVLGVTNSLKTLAQEHSKPVTGGALSVKSDTQEANSETGVITARGNVQINYPAQELQATATQAQYFTRERRLVLSGNVYVLQKGNSMRAETMTYLIDEGKFTASPSQGQQVEAVYIVTDEKNPLTSPNQTKEKQTPNPAPLKP